MNKSIACIGCGTNFRFSENEQRFYERLKFPGPKRCQRCRQAKRAVKAAVKQAAAWVRR